MRRVLKFSHKIPGILRLAILCTVLGVAACQDRLLVEDNTPFGDGVVRLGDTEVAEVDGTKLYLSDVERSAAAQGLIEAGSPLTPSNPVFQRVLDELIDQRLLALGALKQALDQQDETKRRLAVARERILGNILVESHLADRVNETTIRRMYEEQAALGQRGTERRARHILVSDEVAIADIVTRLSAGEDFADVAREVSLDNATREKGGDLGFFSRDMLEPDFTRVAFATAIGDVSAPFATAFGWHVLKVEDQRRSKQPSFEEMRSEILNFMTYDEIQTLLKSLRAQGEVKLLFGAIASVPESDGADRDKSTQKDAP